MRPLEQRDFTDDRSMVGIMYREQPLNPFQTIFSHYALKVRRLDIDNGAHTTIDLNNPNLPPIVGRRADRKCSAYVG